jgi:Fe-S-cluster-containing hydrogenase component 2
MAYFLRTLGVVNLLLILVLGFMARGGRAYCNFFCPIGALDALSNRFGLRLGKRFHILEHRCTGCGECRKVCPTWAINLSAENKSIDQLSCIPCGACQQVCPEQAVIYQRLKRLPEPAKEHSS